jgi:hypothetical protein
MPKDYKVIDVPSMLARKVTRRDPADPTKWIRDEKWYRDIRAIYTSLLEFFEENNLLRSALVYSSVDEIVLMFSDFNEIGQKFIKTGAKGRWLDSFDRPDSKKAFSDVRYLEKALRQMVGAMH